jgi:hypothetical protein
MGLIRNKNPSVAGGMSLRQEPGETIQKVLTIRIIPEYLSAFDPSDHEVMQDAGGVESG